MSPGMRELGVQLAAEIFDKLSDSISQVSHRITRVPRPSPRLYAVAAKGTRRRSRNTWGKKVRYNETVHLFTVGA